MKQLSRYFGAFLLTTSLTLISWAAELPSQTKSLQLVIEMPKAVVRTSEGVSLAVIFRNNGINSLLLNGGKLLGNGSQIWGSLQAELKSASGQQIPITLGWGVPGVAGRIYFLGVPLRAGSSYKLSVGPSDYLVGSGERMKPGRYEIRFVYHGQQSPYRDSTQMPACWEGEVWSNTLRFEVLPE